MVVGLASLEEVAKQVGASRGRGRPRGTGILPEQTIIGLSHVYASVTGLKPGAGGGPFQRFVSAFAKAINRGVFDNDSIVQLIKHARKKDLVSHKPRPSMDDDLPFWRK
jgi:hypothetical protein